MFQLQKRLPKWPQSFVKNGFKNQFFVKCSRFRVVWTIQFCSNFTSIWSKYVWLPMWALATIVISYYFTEICVQWQPPCKLLTLRSMGVALLDNDKLIILQFRGGVIQFLIIKYGESQYIAEVPLEIYEPLFQSMVTS